MPGGNANIILGKWTNLINNEYNEKDKKGRQTLTILKANNKKLLIITRYHITESRGEGIYLVQVQLDSTKGQVKSLLTHRKEFFKDLTEYIVQQ